MTPRWLPCGMHSLVTAIVLSHAPAVASTASHHYVIAIGYNGVPAEQAASLQSLRFADDDAIAFFAFASQGARRGHLLTAIDPDTARRFGTSVPPLQPPSVTQLRAAVADIRNALEEDARNSIQTTVYLYYSGHGAAADGQDPALTLLNGALTRGMLYDEVLGQLPASHIHLFVDACHAEAVVRPRDVEARVVPTRDDDREHFVLANTLARFPGVGAVMAASRTAQTHEWETYLGGVFTHELLSGLRGAADVNGDGRIEYSELAAFLSAANGTVRDPRARLETVTHAPMSDPRTPIVELRHRTGDAELGGRPTEPGPIFIEDDQGSRLVDLNPEKDHAMRLALPADRTWYVHTNRGEATLRASPGARVSWASLHLVAAPTQRRGALESALHDGLFATPFGPSYYRGFIDRATDLVPVPVPLSTEAAHEELPSTLVETHAGADSTRVWGWVSAGTAGVLTLGAGAFGWMALRAKSDFDSTSLERPAADAASHYTHDTAAAAVLAGGAVVTATVAAILLLQPHSVSQPRQASGPAPIAIDF